MTLSAEDKPNTPETKADEAETMDLAAVLKRLQAAQRKQGAPDYDARVEHLTKLEKHLLKRKHDFARAISKDFGHRSPHETLIAEVFVAAQGIRHTRSHLHEWMATQPRETAFAFLPAKNELVPQPLGVIGIISPWNYPLLLALGPLTCALGAGNRAMIKPSELTPETSALLADFISEIFDKDHVTVVTGGADVGAAFSKLPFDHLVFTGSTRVGKIVMKAAAENLVPVTLELGGKSPAIIGDDFPIDVAAERLAQGKCLNAGQTCIAPDYILVPKGKRDELVERFKEAVARMYPKLGDNPDYTSIVTDKHYERLETYLTDARDKGAKVVEVNPGKEELDKSKRKMAPTLVLDPKDDMLVMQDEIFGPILPVLTYKSLDEAIDYVNDHPRPLALYVFSYDGEATEKVLAQTVSGGVAINATLLHVAQDDMPFGGVGPSGMGHYHGYEGFVQFSKMKPVFHQSRINTAGLISAPYGGLTDFAMKLFVGK